MIPGAVSGSDGKTMKFVEDIDNPVLYTWFWNVFMELESKRAINSKRQFG